MAQRQKLGSDERRDLPRSLVMVSGLNQSQGSQHRGVALGVLVGWPMDRPLNCGLKSSEKLTPPHLGSSAGTWLIGRLTMKEWFGGLPKTPSDQHHQQIL